MIILDNSILSAFKRLELLSHLKELISSAMISKEVFNEYTEQWQKTIPNWIKILQPSDDIILKSPPVSLSSADLSIIKLGLEYKIPIASDDKTIRQFAKNLGISITGSLGLLKSLYQNKIIKRRVYVFFRFASERYLYI